MPPNLLAIDEYEYLVDFSATEPWHSRGMSCGDCRVSWTGCWDEFLCPKCRMGELPGSGEKIMTLAEMKTLIEESNALILASKSPNQINQNDN